MRVGWPERKSGETVAGGLPIGILAARLVRWCNGSTTPFGGVCHGSNPCRTANSFSEISQNFAFETAFRHSSGGMSKRFYITTAIYYVNGQPHMGHAYEQVITDVIARVETALGHEPFFLTG